MERADEEEEGRPVEGAAERRSIEVVAAALRGAEAEEADEVRGGGATVSAGACEVSRVSYGCRMSGWGDLRRHSSHRQASRGPEQALPSPIASTHTCSG